MKAKTEESKDVIISSELGGSDDDNTHTRAQNFIFINNKKDEDINPLNASVTLI